MKKVLLIFTLFLSTSLKPAAFLPEFTRGLAYGAVFSTSIFYIGETLRHLRKGHYDSAFLAAVPAVICNQYEKALSIAHSKTLPQGRLLRPVYLAGGVAGTFTLPITYCALAHFADRHRK